MLWIYLKKALSFVQDNVDIFIALLPQSISNEIKDKIRVLLNKDSSGNEKQKEIVDWLMSDVLVKLPKNKGVGKFYSNIPDKTKKHLLNAVITKIFIEIQEEVGKIEIANN